MFFGCLDELIKVKGKVGVDDDWGLFRRLGKDPTRTRRKSREAYEGERLYEDERVDAYFEGDDHRLEVASYLLSRWMREMGTSTTAS